jgi:serine/threonine protein kinase
LTYIYCIQLHRLQHIHYRNFVHRDLKPSNIVTGIDKNASVVYLIDFGLSKQYRNPNTHRHIPHHITHGLTGTAVFASVHNHLGHELSRRDDLESLAYILIYFLCGSLPWQSLDHRRVKGQRAMVKCKQDFPMSDLCHGPFLTLLEHARSLSFDGKPDYDYLHSIFDDFLLQEGYQGDPIFDWDSSF